MEALQLLVAGARRRLIAGDRRLAHLVHQPGGHVAGHRDHSPASVEQRLHGCLVVSADNYERIAAQFAQASDPLQVSGRLLNANDRLQFDQPRHRLRQHIAGRPTRDVVQNLRDRHGLGNCPVVPVQALLGRLVVVRGHQQASVGPGLVGIAGQFDGLGGGVGASACDHRDAPPHLIDHAANHLVVLGDAQSRRFPRRANRDQCIAVLLQMEIHQRGQGHVVHLPGYVHGGCHSNHAALKSHVKVGESAEASLTNQASGLPTALSMAGHTPNVICWKSLL